METKNDFVQATQNKIFQTILADPPWRFNNRTMTASPENPRVFRYPTMALKDICDLPVAEVVTNNAHLYLWVPNALLQEGLEVMKAWGFKYKTNIIWQKIRKDGKPDASGLGCYFRNSTEMILFGVQGKLRTLAPGRSQPNAIYSCKREHSRKPDELYKIIESCSPGPYLELFARGGDREGWSYWGNQAENYEITWKTSRKTSIQKKAEALRLAGKAT